MRIECFVSYAEDVCDIAIQIIETLQSENIGPLKKLICVCPLN